MAPRDQREKTTVPISPSDVQREIARTRASMEVGGAGTAYQMKLSAADIADPELEAQLKEQIAAQMGDRKAPPFVTEGLDKAVPALVSLATSRGEKGARDLEITHHTDGKITLGVRDGEVSHHTTVIDGPPAPLEN